MFKVAALTVGTAMIVGVVVGWQATLVCFVVVAIVVLLGQFLRNDLNAGGQEGHDDA